MVLTKAQELVAELARMREVLTNDKTDIALIEAHIAETEFGHNLAAAREYKALAEARVAEIEALVRAEALAEWEATGEKRSLIGGACGVRVNTALDYDAKEAFAWALDHRLAVKLDVAAFEKIVKASPSACADFVVVKQVPQATIASDLAKIVESWSEPRAV